MTLRDIIISGLLLGSLPFCFFRPWIGVLVWAWISYFVPHRMTWGWAYYQPWAQWIAIATLAGLPINGDWKTIPKSFLWYILLGLWGMFLLSTVFAVYQEDAWDRFIEVSKIILLAVLTLGLFQDKERLRYLVWVIVLSIGFYGAKGGIWALVTGGAVMVKGPPRAFISGNTELGLALVMVLPLILFLWRVEKRYYLKQMLLGIFLFCIVGTIFTYSRGALLGLIVILGMLFLKSRAKIILLVCLLIGLPLFVSFTPDKWFQRMDTIQNYEGESSAQARLMSWELAWRMGLDNPFLGLGFRPFTTEMYAHYTPHLPSRSADAHSIYFQVLAEHGFVGLIVYGSLLGMTLVTLRKVRKRPSGNSDMEWTSKLADAIFSGLIGFAVSGAFLSMSYSDLFFHYVAIAMILQKMSEQAEKSQVGQLGQEAASLAKV